MTALRDARLYLVTPLRPGGRPLSEVLRAALAGGVDLVQLRDKTAGDDEILAAAGEALGVCGAAGVPLLVNDRPDLAARAGADGVHVGQDDGSLADARAAFGDRAPAAVIVGRSTHAPQQLAAAADEGATYAAVGPVDATPTKPGRPAVGLGYVRHAAAHARLPWFAIGGVDEHTLPAALEAGARRVVVVRAICEAPDPQAAAYRLRTMLDAAGPVA